MTHQSLHWNRSDGRDYHLMPELASHSHNHWSLGANTTVPHTHFDMPPPPPVFKPQTTTTDFASSIGLDVLQKRIPEVGHVSTAQTVYQAGEAFVKNYREATAAGQSAIRAASCESINTAVATGVTTGIQSVVTTVSRVAGPPMAAFIATQPELYPAIPVILQSVDGTYKSAETVGYYSGKIAQSGCNRAFDAMDAWN